VTAAPHRLAIVAHRDPRGEVGERVDLLVEGLRTIVDRVVLVADALSTAGRERADALADRVVVAPAGSVIALLAAGLASVDDEVRAAASVLVTDTERYGPLPGVRPGLAARIAERPGETTAWTWARTAPRQALEPSPWFWAGPEALADQAWRTWWRSARDDDGRLGIHDLVVALRAGGVAVGALTAPAEPRVERATLELADGAAPFVERILLTGDPLELEDQALDPAGAWRMLRDAGYPMRVVAADLGRTAPPRRIATNAGAMRVLVGPGELFGTPPRVAVLAHIYYPEALADLQLRLQHLPPGWKLFVTTGSEASKAELDRMIPIHFRSSRPDLVPAFDVRVVDSNRGRDISAFLIGCADLLRPQSDGSYSFDVVLKVHSKRSPQDPYPRASRFQRHVLESLLGDSAAATALLQLFIDEPELGMAMPPQIHVGYPTLGRAWFGNRPLAEQLASRLGIDVPFDEGSPLAPFGSMFAARPEALRPLVDSLGWHDFPDESGYRDGGTAHAVERLFAYAAISEGYAVRTVTTPEIAAESHQMLEWKLQEILRDVPGTSRQQVQLAAAATRAAALPAAAIVRSGRAAAQGAGRLGGAAARGARAALARVRRGGR
jgi:lipopolysaccharide biosynthesis protein